MNIDHKTAEKAAEYSRREAQVFLSYAGYTEYKKAHLATEFLDGAAHMLAYVSGFDISEARKLCGFFDQQEKANQLGCFDPDDDGFEQLRVRCPKGVLVAQRTSYPGEYDEIAIDIEFSDGTCMQLARAGSVAYDGSNEFHVLAWDGNSEDPVAEIQFNLDGPERY